MNPDPGTSLITNVTTSNASWDLNSQNPLLVSEHLTPKGRVLETFISQNGLCLINDEYVT